MEKTLEKVTCIYHKSDLDGQCAAAIVRHKIGPGCWLMGMEYGEAVPWLRARLMPTSHQNPSG